MSNTNTNLQTQTSNTLHNAIIEAGGKDRPPMLAPESTIQVAEGSSETTTEGYMQNYKNNEVNEIRAERLARTANPLALVAQQQPVYHPQNHPTHNNQYSSSRSQQSTRNRGKAIVNSSAPIYDQEPATVTEDDEMSKEKEFDKLMALISLSFKKIYKPTNNNLRTSSNTSRANQDNSLRINRGTGYDNQRVVNVVGARENVDLKKFQAELDRYHDVNYASKVAIDCAKAKGDLMRFFQHQDTISINVQEKEAQIKFYKTRKDKELDKVIALENKVKVLDDIVYKTGQSVQTMNMLNRIVKRVLQKPEFLKKAQRANPRLYDIGCYNDNLALMLAPESDETIRLDKESRSKLSDLINL
ncbi:hypothetical protein Tco_0227353 [Tanacetum coccineum]